MTSVMRDAFLCEVPITVEPYFLILVVLFFRWY